MDVTPRFWISVVCCVVVVGWTAPVIGTDSRSRPTKCPSDVRVETNSCLDGYATQLTTLLHTDNRFFPGLDVEVIRSLCSSLDESMRCIQSILDVCPKSYEEAIGEELSPHLGVRQLCVHPNIYEEYAMNQNCFVRIRYESESCYHGFTEDGESAGRHSAFSSQRHQTQQQQRQYCSQVKRLISCVKNHVRSSSSCQKMAVKLVDILIRASLPGTIHCKDELNVTTPHPRHYAINTPPHDASSGNAVHGLPLRLWYVILSGVVCLHLSRLHLLRTFSTCRRELSTSGPTSSDPSDLSPFSSAVVRSSAPLCFSSSPYCSLSTLNL